MFVVIVVALTFCVFTLHFFSIVSIEVAWMRDATASDSCHIKCTSLKFLISLTQLLYEIISSRLLVSHVCYCVLVFTVGFGQGGYILTSYWR